MEAAFHENAKRVTLDSSVSKTLNRSDLPRILVGCANYLNPEPLPHNPFEDNEETFTEARIKYSFAKIGVCPFSKWVLNNPLVRYA